MLTLTVVMIAYCLAFAGLVLGISIYRGMKRRREMRAAGAELKPSDGGRLGALRFEIPPTFPSSSNSESPHDTPSAKHAA